MDSTHDPALLVSERIRGLRTEEYEELVNNGRFEDEPIELLRGALVEMSQQGPAHAEISAWFHARFVLGLAEALFEIQSHSVFAATEDSAPEPDVAVYPRRPRGQRHWHRSAALLVEVSYSSLRKDRLIKAAIYAESGVPEYWIVNVRARTVEVYTRPGPDGYTHVATHTDGVLTPASLPGFELRVADVPWSDEE